MPSVSVVVTRGGETLVQRAWGLADVANGRAADPSTVYALVRVAFEEGTFVLTMPGGGKSPMAHESGATYAVGSAGTGTTVTFLADAEGREAVSPGPGPNRTLPT